MKKANKQEMELRAGIVPDYSYEIELEKSSHRFGFKSKAMTTLSVSVVNGIVLWLREEGKRTISPNFG